MKKILTRSLFLGSEKSGFGLLFIEKLVCFWSVFSKFWSVLIIGDTVYGAEVFFAPLGAIFGPFGGIFGQFGCIFSVFFAIFVYLLTLE